MTREYIGVDLHQRFFQACAISVVGDRLWEERFPRTVDGSGRFSARVTSVSAMAVEALGMNVSGPPVASPTRIWNYPSFWISDFGDQGSDGLHR